MKCTVSPTSQPTHSYAVNAHYRKPGFGEENKTHDHITITIITKSVFVAISIHGPKFKQEFELLPAISK